MAFPEPHLPSSQQLPARAPWLQGCGPGRLPASQKCPWSSLYHGIRGWFGLEGTSGGLCPTSCFTHGQPWAQPSLLRAVPRLLQISLSYPVAAALLDHSLTWACLGDQIQSCLAIRPSSFQTAQGKVALSNRAVPKVHISSPPSSFPPKQNFLFVLLSLYIVEIKTCQNIIIVNCFLLE